MAMLIRRTAIVRDFAAKVLVLTLCIGIRFGEGTFFRHDEVE